MKPPLTSLDQIPEEKSLHLNEDAVSSSTTSCVTDSDRTPRPEKPERTEKKRRKRRSKGQPDTPKELTPEERAANEERLKKEYEEFVQKQKEMEKTQKEEQKREKKKRKKAKKTEEVKVIELKNHRARPFFIFNRYVTYHKWLWYILGAPKSTQTYFIFVENSFFNS